MSGWVNFKYAADGTVAAAHCIQCERWYKDWDAGKNIALCKTCREAKDA